MLFDIWTVFYFPKRDISSFIADYHIASAFVSLEIIGQACDKFFIIGYRNGHCIWVGEPSHTTSIGGMKYKFLGGAIFDLKVNRLAATSEAGRKKGQWTAIGEMNLPEMTPVQVWLKDLDIPILIVKQTFKNEGGSEGVRYLATNDLNLSAGQITTTYQKRWGVEEYHKSIKQNTAVAKSPTKTVRTQSNHIFASLLAYIKFEKMKFADKTNHFALKSKLYMTAVKAAFREIKSWQQPKAQCVM